MQPLTVRGVTFGVQPTKIAVPLVSTTQDAILAQAAALKTLGVDLAEWRADFYDRLCDEAALTDTRRALRDVRGDTPLLFTIRTRREGGAADLDPARYAALTRAAARSGCIDLADVELSLGEAAARSLIDGIHSALCLAVGSRHDFAATPPHDVMLVFLREARRLGADIPKLAVMANSDADALALLNAAAAYRDEADRPYIAISMGRYGVVTRLACRLSGSCLTFAAMEQGSAPGQLPVARVRELLELL